MTRLTILTAEEVEAIHGATLRILHEVGVVLTEPKARELLGEGEPVVLEGGGLHGQNGGGARDVFDAQTGTRRPAVVQDVRDSTRLLDALENVTTITPFFTPRDVPGEVMSLAMYRYALPHATKPVQGPGVQTKAEVRAAVRMAEVVGPAQEVLTLGVSPVSPLTFSDDVAEAIMEIARHGVALGPLPCPMVGATSPMSLAGSLAQQNATVLASAVLAELVQPGLPIIYCGRLAMMEPRSGISVGGTPQFALISAATVQVGHRYDLPVNVYGFTTDTHDINLQNGYERALNAAIPALAGADELSGIGDLGAGTTGSYTQMVLDDQIATSVRGLLQEVRVDEDALAVEVIEAVMAGPRNFLGQRHTVRYLRAGEVLYPRLADRRTWEEWGRGGREGMVERAQAEAGRLLAEHEVSPLSEVQERALDEILQAAREAPA